MAQKLSFSFLIFSLSLLAFLPPLFIRLRTFQSSCACVGALKTMIFFFDYAYFSDAILLHNLLGNELLFSCSCVEVDFAFVSLVVIKFTKL